MCSADASALLLIGERHTDCADECLDQGRAIRPTGVAHGIKRRSSGSNSMKLIEDKWHTNESAETFLWHGRLASRSDRTFDRMDERLEVTVRRKAATASSAAQLNSNSKG